jgi:D-alanine-D-alanine ligase
MKRKHKVLCLFDLLEPQRSPDFVEELTEDDWQTEAEVMTALNHLGHEVRTVGLLDDINVVIAAVREYQPDVVFNLTEQYNGDRSQDKSIAALLELLRVPYTGAGPMGLALARDKALAKEILAYHRIRVPQFFTFRRGERVKVPKHVAYPVIVKPLGEDASEGIARASLVRRDSDLKKRVEWILGSFGSDAIVEQYIEGREFYCGVMGNGRLRVFPLRELKMGSKPGRPKFLTFSLKWDADMRQRWGIEFGFAQDLPDTQVRDIGRVCKRVYRLLQLRDYGRIDLRITSDGHMYVIEANPNPAIGEIEDFSQGALETGMTYTELIDRIICLAIRRQRC